MFDLANFQLDDMVRCGSELRTLGFEASHMEPVAQAIVRFLYDNLRDGPDGPRACALVRLYKTHAYADLEPSLRRFAQGGPDGAALPLTTKCLTLLATAGDEAHWNSRQLSAGHQVIPLISPKHVDEIPMVTQLIRQFGLEINSLIDPDPAIMLDVEQRTYNVFHVLDALGSPSIPAQAEFVIPYQIASVLGFGGVLLSGDLVAVILFSKIAIPAGTAELFKTIALNIKLALLPYDGDAVFAPREASTNLDQRLKESQLSAVTQLLDVQEQTAQTQTRRLRAKNDELIVILQQLHKTQDQLVAKERLASLGALTAGIAHEIKNPLNFVTNFAQLSTDLIDELAEELAQHRDHLNDDARSNLGDLLANLKVNAQKIREHGKRADSIVSTMLLHSRGGGGRPCPTDLNELLDRYTDLAYHGLRAQDPTFQLAIKTDFDAAVGKVDLNPESFSRVILNLVNNACYAAHTKKQQNGIGFVATVEVISRSQGDKAEIRVRDNGGGIPNSIRDQIFNPFFTTKPPGAGTGLGLSLSHGIVVAEHRGELRVETSEGEWTEFRIILPKSATTP